MNGLEISTFQNSYKRTTAQDTRTKLREYFDNIRKENKHSYSPNAKRLSTSSSLFSVLKANKNCTNILNQIN